jgi:hypothetical protein
MGKCRFIETPILTESVRNRLGGMLNFQESGFAEVEDSVKAVLRIASDETINGEYSFLPSWASRAVRLTKHVRKITGHRSTQSIERWIRGS